MRSRKAFLTKIVYAFSAQVVSIVLSLILVLGLPKVITIEEYGFWQLFILYNSFIGLFLLGLSDGVYLLYGGKGFKDLDPRKIKSELLFTLLSQIFFSVIIILLILFFQPKGVKQWVLIYSSFFLVIGNFITVLGFILLATDRIKEYSKAVFLEKATFLVLIIILYIINQLNLYEIIGIFLISKLVSLRYLLNFYKGIKNVKILELKDLFPVIKKDSVFGITLMLSNLTDTFILGIGKFVIESRWDIKTFAKISLSLSAVFFFIVLITQVGLVLFPTLRKVSVSKQGEVLSISIDFFSFLLLGFYIGYYPAIRALSSWLPAYEQGLQYLVILMPICLYEGKMQIINKTYMKVLNKQNLLLMINISALLLCLIGTIFSGYYLNSLTGVVYSILGCIALRSIVTQIILYRIYKLEPQGQVINDLLLSILFVVLTIKYDSVIALISYTSIYIVFLIIKRKKVKAVFNFIMSPSKAPIVANMKS